MRRKLTFSLVAELVLLGMLGMTAIAENDQTPGNGVRQAPLLGTLHIIGVSKPKNVNTGGASSIFAPLAGKTAIYLHQGDDFAALDKIRADGRAESQLPDAGIDPFIVGEPGDPGAETGYSI